MHKRAFERIFVTNIEVKFSCCNENYTGKITNISENGMFIRTECNFPFEPRFEVLIPRKEGGLKVPVKVARMIKTKNFYDGFGVEVLEQPDEYLEFINSLKIYL